MFTIKHIHRDGSEAIIAADDVKFSPGSPAYTSDDGRSGQTGTPATLWADGKPVTGGTVFVMNAIGKTVARYDLGASPVPLVGDGLTDPRPRGIGALQAGEDRFPLRQAG